MSVILVGIEKGAFEGHDTILLACGKEDWICLTLHSAFLCFFLWI